MSKEAKPTHYLVAILILLVISLFSFTSVYSAPTETNQTSFWKTIYCNTIGDWFNSPRCPLREDIDMVEYNTVTLVDDEPNTQINNTDTNKTESNPPSINKIIINRDSPTTISPTTTQKPIFDLSILNNYVTKDYLSSHNSNTNSNDYVTRDFLSRQVGAIGDSFGRSLSDLSTRLTALIPSTASISNWDSFFTTPSTRILAGTNLSWDGNTLNAVGSAGGVSLSLSNNIFGQSSLAPTTTQNLAISGTGTSTFSGGLESWRQIASPYFQATSTTATSSFSGGLIAGGSTGLTVLQNGNVGVGTIIPLTRLHIGNGTTNNSSDAQVLISRLVDDTISGNGHAFSDSSNISRSGTIGYNSFDGRVNFSGSNNFDHYAGFQILPTYGSSGTMSNYYGFYQGIAVSAGTVLNSYGAYITNPSGAGTVGNNYGVYVSSLTSGTSTNYAIYTAGNSKSYFGGSGLFGTNLGIGNSTSIPTDELVVASSSNASIRITDKGVTSAATAGTFLTNHLDTWVDQYFSIRMSVTGGTPVDRFTILGTNGNVGIGTTTPWRTLGVTA